jgi:transposase InsO family protein
MTNIHPQARTTPKVRAEIQKATGTQREIAAQFNVTVATVRKWRSRDAVQDRSHRPNTLSTTLSPAQEAIVIELRRTLLLPLDDLLVVTREFIHAGASRAALDRLLRRHGISRLGNLQAEAGEAPVRANKTFKSYEPGFVHIDIKYLPQMPDETQRRYLFVAIDRATRWVFVRIYADQSEASSCDFLWRLHQVAPMKIAKVLTDNGSQFTDRFTGKGKKPSGTHAFDKRCAGLGIEHRLAPPRHPQTNGMVERFNGRITEVIAQTRFKSAQTLETTLTHYVQTYNMRIPQRALDHQSPLQAMQAWQNSHPNLFTKRLTGC